MGGCPRFGDSSSCTRYLKAKVWAGVESLNQLRWQRIPLIKLHRHFLLINALALNLSELATNNQRLFKHCSDFLWAEPRHGNRYGHIL